MAFRIRSAAGRYLFLAAVLLSVCGSVYAAVNDYNDGKRFYFEKFLLKYPDRASLLYTGQRLPPPETEGIKTYEFSSSIPFPRELDGKPLALVMDATFYCVEISINGSPVFYQGSVEDGAVSYILNSTVIPLNRDIAAAQKDIRLTVRVHTERERHPLPEFYLTSYSTGVADTFIRNFVNTVMVQAGFVVAIIIALYFFAMFLTYRKPLFLYTAMSALFYSLSMVVITFNYASNPFVLLEKISRTALPLCLFFLFLFFSDLTGILKAKALRLANCLLLIPFVIRTLTAADRFEVSMRFNETSLFYILPNFVIIMCMIIACAATKRFKNNRLVFLSFFITVAAGVHDIVFVLIDRTPYAYVTNIGYMFMVISIFINLSREQWQIFKELQIAKQEVELLNAGLEKKIEVRTAELKDLSLRDTLTGLRNRRFISEFVIELIESFRLSKMLSLENESDRRDPGGNDKVIGLVLLDIDHFRITNDTYGHAAGDKVLVCIADELKKIVRADDIIIRWGGEEFFIILNRTLPEFLPKFCMRLLELFRSRKFQIDKTVEIGQRCSAAGVAFPFCEELPQIMSFEKCISLCDQGISMARESGRDRAVHISFNREAASRENIIMDLHNFQNNMTLDNPIVQIEIIK